MGLPSVGHFMLVVACRANTVGEVFVGAEVSKKLFEGGVGDCLAKSAIRPVG